MSIAQHRAHLASMLPGPQRATFTHKPVSVTATAPADDSQLPLSSWGPRTRVPLHRRAPLLPVPFFKAPLLPDTLILTESQGPSPFVPYKLAGWARVGDNPCLFSGSPKLALLLSVLHVPGHLIYVTTLGMAGLLLPFYR